MLYVGFVGYHPPLSSIVVVYQGTDPFKFFPILTDINFIPTIPDPSLFPGAPSGAKVHNGFLSAYKLWVVTIINFLRLMGYPQLTSRCSHGCQTDGL